MLSLSVALLAYSRPTLPNRCAPPARASVRAELEPSLPVWRQQAALMWCSAAALGPLCDGRHSAHDVLHYARDSIAGAPWLLRAPGGEVLLETCWWVPVAFGGAGVVLGAAHPALDRLWGGGPRPRGSIGNFDTHVRERGRPPDPHARPERSRRGFGRPSRRPPSALVPGPKSAAARRRGQLAVATHAQTRQKKKNSGTARSGTAGA